jgi:transposase InsO family protein
MTRRQKAWYGAPRTTALSTGSSSCIHLEEGKKLINDIHAGECSHHSFARTLAGKAFRSGFYWPTALDDAIEIVKSCEACQFHAKQIHQPAQGLQTIPLSWPFEVWGLDILGPFPRTLGGYRFLFIAVDKFTKWVEVEAMRTISARSAVKFIKCLVCRFGVPNRIITDNGSQFTSGLFKSYCTDIGSKICYASVAPPPPPK